MNFIKNIFAFLKKLFNKEDNIKMIKAPIKVNLDEEKVNFRNSLKVNVVEKKKRKVETLICFGDGLGIQPKIKL